MHAIGANRADNHYAKAEYFFITLFFLWLVWGVFSKDKIPAVDGLGWDGETYSNIARQFFYQVFHHQLSEYKLQRIFPSAIIYFFSKITHISLTVSNMPMAFSIYNTLVLGFAVFIWRAVATKLQWRPEVRLVSFAGLFANYAILKMNTYYPVLTDTSAFFCGLLMLYFYITKRNYFVLLTGIVGAFTFPTLLYVALILFIFQEMKINNHQNASSLSRHSVFFAASLAFFISLAGIVSCSLISDKSGYALGGDFSSPVLFFSATALFGYLFYALRPFYISPLNLISLMRSSVGFRAAIALMILIVIKVIIHFLSSGQVGPSTPWIFLRAITIRALAYPFIFLISDVLYYGPFVCLLIYFWKEVVTELKNKHLALFVITIFYVILSIDSEARQIINFLPIAVFALAEILNQRKLSTRFTYGFVFLSLLVSRCWFPLNHGTWPSLLTHPPEVTLEFPMQWYFMSQAPWMSHRMYLIGSISVVIVFFLVYGLSRRGVTSYKNLPQDFLKT